MDRFLWGSDYPHDEGTYPYTREALRRAFPGTDPADLRRMLAGNAAEVYGFDLDVLDGYAATCGPTYDEIATPLGSLPADSNSPAFTRP
ncbi:amidohydrolase family protein [Yinghuangia aomiensis]